MTDQTPDPRIKYRPPVVAYPLRASIRSYRERASVASLFVVGLYSLFLSCPFVTLSTYNVFSRLHDDDYVLGVQFVLQGIELLQPRYMFLGGPWLCSHLLLLVTVVFDLLPSIFAIDQQHKTLFRQIGNATAAVAVVAMLLTSPLAWIFMTVYESPTCRTSFSVTALILPAAFLMLLIREWRTPSYKRR